MQHVPRDGISHPFLAVGPRTSEKSLEIKVSYEKYCSISEEKAFLKSMLCQHLFCQRCQIDQVYV